jgi:hypothetical protein
MRESAERRVSYKICDEVKSWPADLRERFGEGHRLEAIAEVICIPKAKEIA